MFRLILWFRDRRTLIWVVPAAAVAVAVALCILAKLADVVFPNPEGWPMVDESSLDSLLVIIASSMLAVATFSLGVMVSAFATVQTGATPRATELVMGDEGIRAGIGAFIGAFVYAVVAKAALSFDAYDQAGRVTLMAATLLVLAYLVVRLILWVRTMSSLGRLSDTLDRIEHEARAVLHEYADEPLLGGSALDPAQPAGPGAFEVTNRRGGYLTHVDVAGLQEEAAAQGVTVRVMVRPGAFIGPRTVLAVVTPDDPAAEPDPDDIGTAIRYSFIRGHQRSFDQDPRYGLIVLSEVAQRALSPAVNDPGTGVQVASLLTELVLDLQSCQQPDDAHRVKFDRVAVVALDERDLIRDGFSPIARDGAAFVEIALRLQKLLWHIANHRPGSIADAARDQARESYQRSMDRLTLGADRDRLTSIHQRLWGATEAPGA